MPRDLMRPDVLALYPDGVVGADLTDFSRLDMLWPDELPAIAHAVDKRVREFTAGRSCARKALLALGSGPVSIPRRADRAPAWPREVVGSISHCDDYCGVVVAWAQQFAGLGFDVEIRGSVQPEWWEHIATAREIAGLRCLQNTKAEDLATLLFSAKEAFYKAQYAISQSWLDFQDAGFQRLDDERFEIMLLRSIAGFAEAGTRIEGRYLLAEDHVFTAVSLSAQDQVASEIESINRGN